jgi:hypothetical protein
MENYARITINLSTAEYLRLVDSAKQELRPARNQARLLLRQALGVVDDQRQSQPLPGNEEASIA